MALTFHTVPRPLKPYVNRLIISEDFDHEPLHVRPWATGAIYLIYFYNELSNYEVIVEGDRHELSYPVWMAGQLKYHKVDLHMKRHTAVVIAELRPQSFWQFFNIPGEWLTGRTCQMHELGPDMAARADEAFAPVGESAQQALLQMTGFLQQLAAHAGPSDPDVDHVLKLIGKKPASFNISTAAQNLGVSRQTLSKRFTRVVGIGPKFYSRVAQVNHLIDLLVARKRMRLAILALQAGFYDQAHMTKAMTQFFSHGPNRFLRGDHETFLQFLQKLSRETNE